MFQSAVSWMVSPVMLTKSLGQSVERRGNTHQFFAPVSVYPTRDGFIYLAVGNDKQWEAVVATPEFGSLACDEYRRNAGRITQVQTLNDAISRKTSSQTTREWIEFFTALGVPVSAVQTIRDVVADELVSRHLVTAYDGRTNTTVHLPAPVIIPSFLREHGCALRFPPRLGEDNPRILGELGYDLQGLRERGVV